MSVESNETEEPPVGPEGSRVVRLNGATFFIRPEVAETFRRMAEQLDKAEPGKTKPHRPR